MGAQLNWQMPVRVYFGSGSLKSYRPSGPVVALVDSRALSESVASELQRRWDRAQVTWVWHDLEECEVTRIEPLAQQIAAVLDSSPKAGMLAIGGGTTLDISKILRWRPVPGASRQDVHTAWRLGTIEDETKFVRHHLVCWPTTAGTGSEVSASATLWDRSSPPLTKRAWQPKQGHADEAWVDPELTLGCPVLVTRDCALDALAHALESIWNKRASIVSRPLAYRACRLVLSHLKPALIQPDSILHRSKLSEAALLAGMAMAETQTALAHALSYDLTLKEGYSHGRAVASWLSYVAKLVCEEDQELKHELQTALGTPLDPSDFLRDWLGQLSITSRSAQDLPCGRADVAAALRSQRGKNLALKGDYVV